VFPKHAMLYMYVDNIAVPNATSMNYESLLSAHSCSAEVYMYMYVDISAVGVFSHLLQFVLHVIFVVWL
jgi:hypothetical protein